MKKFVFATIILLVIGSIIFGSLLNDQFANANSRKKINFTKTLTSTQDPGSGNDNQQMAITLSPNKGTMYYGTLTYTSSDPVEIIVLHEINQDESKGQPIWTVDGQTIYGLSSISIPSNSGSLEFTGAALAFHRSDNKPFTVTVSIDGWIRGQSPEQITQKIEPMKEPLFVLSRTSIPVTIPLHKGIYDNSTTYYIMTDVSDKNYVQQITEKQKWQVNYSPMLSNLKHSQLGKIYLFTNGIKGEGLFGSQEEVLSQTPSDSEYSAFNKVIEVAWKKGQNPMILHSEEELLKAKENGRVDFNDVDVIINSAQIIWPNGQMKIREDKTIDNETQYKDGQITDINKDKLTVTFVAHRAWSYDGKTIYQIFTDASPSGPATMMGITPTNPNNFPSNSTSVLYQIKNGIVGPGPLGFQPSILNSTLTENYSPICRVHLLEWIKPENAQILENKDDIDSFLSSRDISVEIARSMNNDYLINCPLVDPYPKS